MVARVHDSEAKLVGELLTAHAYLRQCGIPIDLVLVDEQATGYANEGTDTLRRALGRRKYQEWIGQRGGIHMMVRDQIGEEELRMLEASARVFLDTRDVSLVDRLSRPATARPALPAFTPSVTDDTASVSPRLPTRTFDNGIGGFTRWGAGMKHTF